MNKIKNGLTFIFVTAFLFTSMPVHASDTEYTSLDVQKEFLQTLGVPTEYLNLVSEEKVNSMYNRYSVSTYDSGSYYEWGGYQVVEKDMLDGSSEQRGIIPTAKLQLVLGYMNELNGSRINGVILESSYRWKSIPAVLYEDGITLNWESSIFNADGFYSDTGGEFIPGRYVTFSFKSSPDKRANGGYGWGFPITSGSHPGELPVALYGGGSVHLIPVSPLYTTSGKRCSFIIEYGHKYITLTGSVSFNANGISGVSFSTTTGMDILDDSITYYSGSNSGGSAR